MIFFRSNDFLLNSEISVLTMAIIAKCAFGMTIQDLGGKDDPFIKNAKRLVDRKQFKSPSVILLCKWSINRFQIFCFKRCYNTLNSFYRLTSGQTFEVDDEKILPNGELELLLQHSRNHVQRTSKQHSGRSTINHGIKYQFGSNQSILIHLDISLDQKFHDFPEMTTQAIASYTKEENGKKVPMWTEEQVSEIVTAQVSI